MNTQTRSQLSAAAHIGWLVPVPFLGTSLIHFLCKDSEVRIHSLQALFYQLGMLIVGMLVFSGSFFLFSILPLSLAGIVSKVLNLACLAFLIPPVLGAMAGFQGKRYQYPVIGHLAHLLPLPK